MTSECANWLCSKVFSIEASGARTFTRQGWSQQTVKHYARKVHDVYVCSTICKNRAFWVGYWNNNPVLFKRIDVKGDGNCLFLSISTSGLISITREELLDWIKREVEIQRQSENVDLQPSTICLANEMLSIFELYREDPQLLNEHLELDRVDANWYVALKTIDESTQNMIESILRQESILVRTILCSQGDFPLIRN